MSEIPVRLLLLPVILLAASLVIVPLQAQTTNSHVRVDFWEDIGLFGTAPANTRIDSPRKKIGVQGVARDHADKKCGDWSFRYAPAAKAGRRLERTYIKNDIFWARQSTWWLDGSENHDLNSKACNLVSSRIFMNEPDYRTKSPRLAANTWTTPTR
jgi:hypothetical protein